MHLHTYVLILQFPLLSISLVPYSVIVALKVCVDAIATAVANTSTNLYVYVAIVRWPVSERMSEGEWDWL